MNIKHNYKKKSGSLLIEAVMSILILSITSAFILNSYLDSNKELKRRILNEDLNRQIKNLECEIKYNVSKDDIETMFKNKEIRLCYDENLGRSILNNNITELPSGSDISIKMISEDEEGILFKIEADVNHNGIKANACDEFRKSWWMDEE